MNDPSQDEHRPGPVSERLEYYLSKYPRLASRLLRQLLVALHTRGVVPVEEIYDQARQATGHTVLRAPADPNQPEDEPLDDDDRQMVERITRDLVVRHFTPAELDDQVNLTLKREEVHSLEDLVTQGAPPFRKLAERIARLDAIPEGETRLEPAEVLGIRVALIRHFLSDDLEFIRIAKHHLRVRDFHDITRRIVGSPQGMGRIGGKAGGMILAHQILSRTPSGDGAPVSVNLPESYYIRSDVINDFMGLNRLHAYQNQKYKTADEIRNEYPLIKGVFRNSTFPVETCQQLRGILHRVGNHPLIVRSSSLLEDRIGTAFSGKYASIFLPNQGELEDRLTMLLNAISEVFASTMAPDPIIYRQEHHLIDYDEDMAVLIQKVVGTRVGKFFLPAFAGVAFSRNEYRWSPRIRREDGLVRIVMGLGTRAVDRVGADYPRMAALGAPTIRPELDAFTIKQRSQRTIDVINLEGNQLEHITLATLLAEGERVPALDRMVSVYRDKALYRLTGTLVDAPAGDLVITFDKLLAETGLAAQMRAILARLEAEYGSPVDIEFAHDGAQFYVLQCRTQSQLSEIGRVEIPQDVAPERVIFTANKFVRSGIVDAIEYVVYVDPRAYDAVATAQRRVAIGRAVGRINRRLADRRFVLLGPGRWGTNDVRLGVQVTYADINKTRMIIEVARARGNYVPEVSFGTHFFQDLVEADIHYLPLYPDEPGNAFHEEFLLRSPNMLAELSPTDAEFADQVRVIHVPAVARGKKLCVLMDGETERALAYLK